MKNTLVLPRFAVEAQSAASDPGHSAWVCANAGSGKTHVLSRRVMRLLLHGTDPARILCLTYTRMAAANMSNRIFRELSNWAMLPDQQLIEEIALIEGKNPDIGEISKARRLFAKALETPGGLKIQTVHAFCESILQRFPLEANVMAHFRLPGADVEKALIERAKRDMITDALRDKNSVMKKAFSLVLAQGGEAALDRLFKEILSKRDDLRSLIEAIRSLTTDPDHPFGPFLEEFGFAQNVTEEEISASAWPLSGFSFEFFTQFSREAEATNARFVLTQILPGLKEVFEEADPIRRLKLAAQALLKADASLYEESSFKALLRQNLPDLMKRYHQAGEQVRKTSQRLALFHMIQQTIAVFVITDFLICRYEQLKASKGFLDFNDLITRTATLLAHEDTGAWVRYRLDEGIDHILLDEAQDTSPGQWKIIKTLSQEFFTGDNAPRTIFAVGDEKQSIYSFQGAVPERFSETGHELSLLAKQGQRPFQHVDMTLSFRSVKDVLEAVDRVFSGERHPKILTSHQDRIRHDSLRKNVPGYLELWGSIGEKKLREPQDWHKAIDQETEAQAELAEKISDTLREWMDSEEVLPGSGTPVTPGDILVLVRKRDRFVHKLVSCLKRKKIPVAGMDRLKLRTHIAVQDLLALTRFLLRFEDDLSLAAVLKSPLFGMDEKQLLELASRHGKTISLMDSLRHAAQQGKSDVAEIVTQLEAWSREALLEQPFEFYSLILQRDGCRKKIIERLGMEAGEILDEFLNFCLARERAGFIGLQDLSCALETQGPEIKREMEYSRNEVRIMTVHAAKGLEAPIVFLVDGGSLPCPERHLPDLVPIRTSGELRNVSSYLWRAGVEMEKTPIQAYMQDLREERYREYHRLLYVGMTRARDRLILCGYHGKREPDSQTWCSIVRQSLESDENIQKIWHPVTRENILRFSVTPEREAVKEKKNPCDERTDFLPLPDGMAFSLPSSKEPFRRLLPSRATRILTFKQGKQEKHKEASKRNAARSRGILIHHMLQILPEIELSGRRSLARELVDQSAPDYSEKKKEDIVIAVCSLLESPEFSFLFSKKSLAETSIMGTVSVGGQQYQVSARIDRLAVQERTVWIVDYKTLEVIPSSWKEIEEDFLMQMALYASLLRKIYPQKEVRTGILFTEGPCFFEIPESAHRIILDRGMENQKPSPLTHRRS